MEIYVVRIIFCRGIVNCGSWLKVLFKIKILEAAVQFAIYCNSNQHMIPHSCEESMAHFVIKLDIMCFIWQYINYLFSNFTEILHLYLGIQMLPSQMVTKQLEMMMVTITLLVKAPPRLHLVTMTRVLNSASSLIRTQFIRTQIIRIGVKLEQSTLGYLHDSSQESNIRNQEILTFCPEHLGS